MKKVILMLISMVSLSVVSSTALAGDKFKFDLDDARIIIDFGHQHDDYHHCLLYTSPSPRDGIGSRMPSSA